MFLGVALTISEEALDLYAVNIQYLASSDGLWIVLRHQGSTPTIKQLDVGIA